MTPEEAIRQTEAQFQRAVIALAEMQRWRVYHAADVRGQLRSGTSVGFPDLVLLRVPRLMLRELKVGRNKPTEAQSAWLRCLREAGCDAKIWRPDDWDAIEKELA